MVGSGAEVVVAFDDAPCGGHGGEASVECGCADTAAGAQLGEWPGPIGAGEGGGDALVDGRRGGLGRQLVVQWDGLEIA